MFRRQTYSVYCFCKYILLPFNLVVMSFCYKVLRENRELFFCPCIACLVRRIKLHNKITVLFYKNILHNVVLEVQQNVNLYKSAM